MRAFLAIVVIQVAIAAWVVFRPREATDTRVAACVGLRQAVEDAARCRAFPQMWEKWDSLNAAYGNKTDRKGVAGCPILLNDLHSYGLFDNDVGVTVFQIFTVAHEEQNEEEINQRVLNKTGYEFCQIAEINQWVEKYVRNTTPKTNP